MEGRGRAFFFFFQWSLFIPFIKCSHVSFFLISTYLFSSLQSLSIHLTSTKGPIEVLLCPDEENDPRSPVKNGNMDINGNSPFLKVLQGLFQIDFPSTCSLKIKKHLSHGLQFCHLWKFVFISTQDSLFIFQSIFPMQIILQGFSLSDKRGVFYVHLKVL